MHGWTRTSQGYRRTFWPSDHLRSLLWTTALFAIGTFRSWIVLAIFAGMAADDAGNKPAKDYRTFPDRPLQTFIDAVSDHLAKTGEPETHPDLYRGRLEKDEPFHILKHIRIDTRRRPEGDRAPCPMCHSNNKFEQGELVYLLNLKAVAVIGSECASSSTRTEAHREFDERERRERDENYLLLNIPRLPQWQTNVSVAVPPAEEARRLANNFRKEGKVFFEPLRKVRANSGRLVVTEVLQTAGVGPSGMRTSGSSVQTRDHQIGILAGLSAVSGSFNPVRQIEEVRACIARHIQPDDDAAFHYVADLAVAKRREACLELQKAVKDFAKVLRDIDDFRAFLRPANLQLINDWAGHPDAALHFTASLGTIQEDGTRRLEFSTRGNFFYHIVRPELWTPTRGLELPTG